jgi:tetratricopeptide (TPR) repeat protein
MATKQAQRYKELGNIAFKKGDHQTAIENYTYATECDPNNPVFFTNRSTAYYKMEKYDKSLRDADKAIKKDKTWAKGHYRRAMVLFHQHKKYVEALKSFETAIKLKPKDVTFKNEEAKCKAAYYKTVSQAELTKMEANKLFKKGSIDEAIILYSRALSECKTTDKELLLKADIYANRALCHKQQYSDKKVIADCTKAIVLNPNHVKCFIRRAQARESLEKYKDALDDFQQANKLAQTPVAVKGASRCRKAWVAQEKLREKEGR